MKKVFLTAAAVVLAALASCNKENNIEPVSSYETSLVLGLDTPGTKTDLSGTVKLLWAEGDKISVATGESGFVTFSLTDGAGTASGTFSVAGTYTIGSSAQVYYPASICVDWDKVNLPAEYDWSEAGINAPMLGWINNGEYNNLSLMCGVIKLDIANIPDDAAKLVFTAAGQQVSGEFTKDSGGAVNTVSSESGNTITINFTAGERPARTFFIPVPAGTYAGCTIALQKADGTDILKKRANITVAKDKIVYAPALSASSVASQTLFSNSEGTSEWKQFDNPLSGVKAGYHIKFVYTVTDSYPSVTINHDTPENQWNWTELCKVMPSSDNGTSTEFDIVLSESQAELLSNAPHIAIAPNKVRITSVAVEAPGAETVIWTGSVDLGNYTTNFDEDGLKTASFWSNISEGTKLNVYLSENTDLTYCQLYIKSASGWGNIAGLSLETGLTGLTHHSFTLTKTQADAIKAAGIVMQGCNYTITKLTLSK